jgi:UDP-N-acetylglucosamine acyltransferase
MIHATAVIHPQAQIDPTVSVGPYAVIDAGVVVGAHCVVGPHVYLTGRTTIGTHNRFHAGCVIGNIPQDLKYRGAPSQLRVGNHNSFREHVTVNCPNDLEEDTTIGSHNLLMASSHVAHNCHVGDHVILANGALLGGHVTVEDRVVISGNGLVHQFVRVGTLAMMQGGSAISKDLPPYTMARGDNRICGLNSVGLRRAGLTAEQRLEIRRLYHSLFRSGKTLRKALTDARQGFTSPTAMTLIEFVATSKRGVCGDRAKRPVAEESE